MKKTRKTDYIFGLVVVILCVVFAYQHNFWAMAGWFCCLLFLDLKDISDKLIDIYRDYNMLLKERIEFLQKKSV